MSKGVFAVILWGAAAVGALAARAAQQRGGSCMLLATAFSGGALLSAGLVHLLADASAEMNAEDSYPWSELLCGLGCILTHAFEALAEAHWVKAQPKVASHEQAPPVPEPEPVGRRVTDEQEEQEREVEPEETLEGWAFSPDRSSRKWGASSNSAKDKELHDRKSEDEAREVAKLMGQHPSSTEAAEMKEITFKGHGFNAGSQRASFAGYLLMLALSFHSLLEGLSLGAAKNPRRALHLFVAILMHKGIAAFSLGVAWLSMAPDNQRYAAAMVFFASVTPVGVLLGKPMEGSTLGLLVTALSSGTFVYVGLVEACPGLRTPWLPGRAAVLQLASYASGFVCMAVLGAVT